MMNAKNGRTENNKISSHQSENNQSQISDKDINIIIPKEESNKTLKKIKEVKNSKPKKQENNNEEIKNENNLDLREKILKAYKRLDIRNLLNCDNFAENYMFYPCKNEIIKLQQDPNYPIEIPYSTIFYDNILLRDESIFFIHDKTQKYKFLEETDKKKIKTENIELNFGEDPTEKYYKILRGNYPNPNKSIAQLQENLNNFHVFKCLIPNYMNINMENFKENELINIRNGYYNTEQVYLSMNSTKINSGASNIESNIKINGNEFLLNNEFNDEETNKELKENSGKSYINKKRKLKK